MTNYISQAESNKLIRAVLKESFPGIRFSVRGTKHSTNISWVDGPNAKQVEDLVSVFEGSYFDGMIDYKGSRYAWLDGEEVHFCCDFIFTNREASRVLQLRIANRIRNKYRNQCEYLAEHSPEEIIADWKQGKLWNIQPCGGWDISTSLQGELHNAVAKHSLFPFVKPSPTLGRVSFKGADGYGAGQPDRDGNGNGYGGYPSHERI